MEYTEFKSASELIKICKEKRKGVGKIVISNSASDLDTTQKELKAEMKSRITIIRESIQKGLKISKRSKSGLSGGDAKKIDSYAKKSYTKVSKTNPLLGKTLLKAIKYSFAIMEQNARFGRIVALPTAGSAGTVPGALFAAADDLKLSDSKLIDSMFVAGGIGMITGENAMLAGATGGCQAEVGTASAMAAGALTSMRGGSPKQIFDAAAIALKGLLGLVCDPIAGLVECPCVKRNSTAISNSYMASELVLAGVESNVNFDEVLVAMNNVAKLMAPELKETARGGLAISQTGKEVAERLGIGN
ncbi:L-serine ammonia-lyase, iron-sulfur-dependent, subunit alpha [Candidatus Dojkabacteria bacterium]|nr:L-serine ammonia-lyase, iron-sulfur-dependent, subunit alpha [Candidatus Dojkabacteria bacterium]